MQGVGPIGFKLEGLGFRGPAAVSFVRLGGGIP